MKTIKDLNKELIDIAIGTDKEMTAIGRVWDRDALAEEYAMNQKKSSDVINILSSYTRSGASEYRVSLNHID